MTTQNTLKTVALLGLLTGLFLLIGRLLGGPGGLAIALIMALVMNGVAYWFSDRIALKMSGARELAEDEAPWLHQMLSQLAYAAGIPKPRLYLIQDPSPNAFATGRNPEHSAVAVTSGIVNLLNRNELAGVIAHELAHIKNRDTLIATIAASIAGAITYIAHMAQWALMFGGFGRHEDEEGEGLGGLVGGLVLIVVAPIAAMILQMAISRAREFQADATGARICGDPLALAGALEKLHTAAHVRPLATANPATAPLFIVNPFAGETLLKLFSTHPPIVERVQRLRAMAWSQYGAPLDVYR